jgi:hypothetical protein
MPDTVYMSFRSSFQVKNVFDKVKKVGVFIISLHEIIIERLSVFSRFFMRRD